MSLLSLLQEFLMLSWIAAVPLRSGQRRRRKKRFFLNPGPLRNSDIELPEADQKKPLESGASI